jgi:hypothetical protein
MESTESDWGLACAEMTMVARRRAEYLRIMEEVD